MTDDESPGGPEQPPGPAPGPIQPPPETVGRPGHGGGPMREMVNQWLEKLKQTDPEEYQRLLKLKEDDPQAFRAELEGRLRKERVNYFLDQHPQIRAAIEQMPQQDRDTLMSRLGGPEHGPGGPNKGPGQGGTGGPGMGFGWNGPGQRNPEVDKVQGEIQQLAKTYRSSTNATEQATLKGDMKTKLGDLFDLRENARREELKRLQEHVADLQKKLDSRQANKDQIIEKRLQEIIGGDELAW